MAVMATNAANWVPCTKIGNNADTWLNAVSWLSASRLCHVSSSSVILVTFEWDSSTLSFLRKSWRKHDVDGSVDNYQEEDGDDAGDDEADQVDVVVDIVRMKP